MQIGSVKDFRHAVGQLSQSRPLIDLTLTTGILAKSLRSAAGGATLIIPPSAIRDGLVQRGSRISIRQG